MAAIYQASSRQGITSATLLRAVLCVACAGCTGREPAPANLNPEQRTIIEEPGAIPRKFDDELFDDDPCGKSYTKVKSSESVSVTGDSFGHFFLLLDSRLDAEPLRSDNGEQVWEVDVTIDFDQVERFASAVPYVDDLDCPNGFLTAPGKIVIRPEGSPYEYRGPLRASVGMTGDGYVETGIPPALSQEFEGIEGSNEISLAFTMRWSPEKEKASYAAVTMDAVLPRPQRDQTLARFAL